MTNYLDFPVELINELETNKSLTRAVNFAHGCSDSNFNHLHFCTMYEGKRYKTTQELKDKAKIIYDKNVLEAIKNVGNKLVFVGMGCEYKERYNDDVCNHRIRTEITNPQGRKFFIEVGTWGDVLMRFDFVIDRDQEKEYNDKASFYHSEIEKAGGFWKVSHKSDLMINYKKYQSQPYYWYKREQWQNLRLEYTKTNILNIVNDLFECNFSELEVDYNHLTTDIYSSISPKL